MRIRHKGLRQLAAGGPANRIDPALWRKLRRILTALEAARDPSALDNPGWRLHTLKGGRWTGYWSIRVTANWRVVFLWQDGQAVGVDFVDYH